MTTLKLRISIHEKAPLVGEAVCSAYPKGFLQICACKTDTTKKNRQKFEDIPFLKEYEVSKKQKQNMERDSTSLIIKDTEIGTIQISLYTYQTEKQIKGLIIPRVGRELRATRALEGGTATGATTAREPLEMSRLSRSNAPM